MRTKVVKVKGMNVRVRVEVERNAVGGYSAWRVWHENGSGAYGQGVACHWETANARAKRCVEELECDWLCATGAVSP